MTTATELAKDQNDEEDYVREMANEIISTIDVCVTCMYAINGLDEENAAEGSVEASMNALEALTAACFDISLSASMDALEALTVAGCEITDTDEDEHFSMSQCALCRSYLGGSRYGATLVETVGV